MRRPAERTHARDLPTARNSRANAWPPVAHDGGRRGVGGLGCQQPMVPSEGGGSDHDDRPPLPTTVAPGEIHLPIPVALSPPPGTPHQRGSQEAAPRSSHLPGRGDLGRKHRRQRRVSIQHKEHLRYDGDAGFRTAQDPKQDKRCRTSGDPNCTAWSAQGHRNITWRQGRHPHSGKEAQDDRHEDSNTANICSEGLRRYDAHGNPEQGIVTISINCTAQRSWASFDLTAS